MRITWREQLSRNEAAARAAHRRRRLVFLVLAGLSILFLRIWGSHPDCGPLAAAISKVLTPFEELEEKGIRWVTGRAERFSDLLVRADDLRQLRERCLQAESDLLEARLNQPKNRTGQPEALGPVRLSTREIRILPARIIGRRDVDFQWLILDRGAEDGIRPYDAVLNPEGAIGWVDRVLPRASRVVLLTDRNSVIGARARDPEEGAPIEGQIRGLPDGIHLVLEVKTPRKLPAGAPVSTSPLSTIFPGPYFVGSVVEELQDRAGLVDRYVVKPHEGFFQAVDVLVMTGRGAEQAMALRM
jgi:rod shape-determining protein MreC